MERERFGTIAIVGVGLIGGAVGLALRTRELAGRVVGIGRDAGRLSEARRLGVIDDGTTEPARGLADAEVVVVCTPVARVADDIRIAARHAGEDVLITDAGSTKRRIVAQAEQDERIRRVFVGAHPLAGSERKGAAHATAELLAGRTCVLTPTERTPADRLERAREFWSALDCRLMEMDPETHDEALARTSHLPHVVAAALAAIVPEELLPLAAGAYRDGTRVAAADGPLWTDIFLANRRPVLDALDALRGQLADFEHALRSEDEFALRLWWQAAKARRTAFNTLHDPGS